MPLGSPKGVIIILFTSLYPDLLTVEDTSSLPHSLRDMSAEHQISLRFDPSRITVENKHDRPDLAHQRQGTGHVEFRPRANTVYLPRGLTQRMEPGAVSGTVCPLLHCCSLKELKSGLWYDGWLAVFQYGQPA